MSFLWDMFTNVASQAGDVAGKAAVKTQLKTELLLIEREITARQSAFGVELYDYVAPLSKNPGFYSSDDTLTVTLQPPLITAQREIAALEIKRGKLMERIKLAEVHRAGAFKPAQDWTGKVVNLGKSTVLAGNEAKLSTEMALLKAEVTHHKQIFGISLYKTLEELEDTKQWLPTDREIRSIYDNCRRDIEKIKKRKVDKEQQLRVLDGEMDPADRTGPSEEPSMYSSPSGAQPSMYAATAPAQQATYPGTTLPGPPTVYPTPTETSLPVAYPVNSGAPYSTSAPASYAQPSSYTSNPHYSTAATYRAPTTSLQSAPRSSASQPDFFDAPAPVVNDPLASSFAPQQEPRYGSSYTPQPEQRYGSNTTQDPFASMTTTIKSARDQAFATAVFGSLTQSTRDPFSFGAGNHVPPPRDPFSSAPAPAPAGFDPFTAKPAASSSNYDPFAGL